MQLPEEVATSVWLGWTLERQNRVIESQFYVETT